MVRESLVKATVELQGFLARWVTGDLVGLAAELAPDWRYAPHCGRCEQRGASRDTRWVRRFRHVPLWGIPVTLVYAPRRVPVRALSGRVHVEALPWAVGQQRSTRALLVTIATWTRVLPWQPVARLFGCAWGTVERAVEAAVAYGLTHRDLTGVTHIGIDEISRKKGHGIDAPICQDTRSGGLNDLLASAKIGHDALVDLASEETFQAPDDLSLGSAVRRAT